MTIGSAKNCIKFSVLMAVYHKEIPAFFEIALESILCRQTLIPNEFVLVCDGPLTEELYSIIAKFESLFPDILKIYQLENNEGLGKALAFGLTKCTNPLIARADSDDVCVSTRFEKQIDFLKKNPHIDILGSFIDEFDSDFNIPKNKKTLPITHEKICEMAKFRNPINHMTVIYKKEIILNCGSYQHLPYLEDYFLWVRAIENGAILGNLDEYLVHARIGNGMVQRRSNTKYIASWKTLSQYMLEHNMLSMLGYLRNMISITVFVYLPVSIKELIYKNFLRKNCRSL